MYIYISSMFYMSVSNPKIVLNFCDIVKKGTGFVLLETKKQKYKEIKSTI